jgi:hypothetical protein
MSTVVHTDPVTGETHTHAPSSAKIVALGAVTLAGGTFIIDRDGQIEAGQETEFGVEQVAGETVAPTAAWLVKDDGTQMCEKVKAMAHDGHCHFNVLPLNPVKRKPVKFVLQVGEEEALVDYHAGAAPSKDGILSVFKASDAPEWRGYLELKLHGDAGDLELWLYTSAGHQTAWSGHTGKPVPFDVPMDTVIKLTFQSHKGKAIELHVRNGDTNEDEEGIFNVRDSGTNYFIFPGESGQDPEWLKGEEWRGLVTVAFEANGKSFLCDPFVLVPHEVL